MSRSEGLSQWTATVSTHLPHLSRPQAAVLAWWRYGIVLAQCCGLTTVAAVLAGLLGTRENTVRERLRAWYRDAHAKCGDQRQEVAVTPCCAPWLRWVLTWWSPDDRRLVLARDASSLDDRFVVLALSVAYRGCARPVAWAVLPANQPGAWRPHWERLLADRGLYARGLFRAIQARGWHPFLRSNLGGQVRPAGAGGFIPLRALVPAVNGAWCGWVRCFARQGRQRPCTLLARGDVGYTAPWVMLTDLAADGAEAAWSGRRRWIEQGVKDGKRGAGNGRAHA
jgi:hypothetical protein